MCRRLAIVMLVAATAFPAGKLKAQSSTEAFPRSLLGFLKPGMHVGVDYTVNRSGDAEEHFSLKIFDDTGYRIAVDTRLLSLDELRRKYPVIEKHAEKTLSNYQQQLPDRAKKLARGKRYAKPELSMSVSRRTLLCKVIHVGDDYVLVSYGEAEKRRVLPKHMIKRVYWSEGLPHLYASARVVAVDTDETEQR